MARSEPLNAIGPAVSISSRNGKWQVRFRLPTNVAERHNLPRQAGLETDKLRGDLSDPKRRLTEFRREATRIGAKLDLLVNGHDAPAPGQTLARWLDLVETAKVRSQSKRRIPKHKTWQHLVGIFVEEFKAGTIAREGNQTNAVKRLESIRNLGFGQDRYPPDISAEEWDLWFDSLMQERADPQRGTTTAKVLDLGRRLIDASGQTTIREIAAQIAIKRQSVEAHVNVLVRKNWLERELRAKRDGLKKPVALLTPGTRYREPYECKARKHTAKTTNKTRALIRRIYECGIRHRLFRDNPILLTAKRSGGRRALVTPSYRTLTMIEQELDRRKCSPEEVKRLYRYRVLDEGEQTELIRLAMERPEVQMLEPLICGLHGMAGIDIREILRGGYDSKHGILSGQRHKTGQVKFAVPVAPALKPYLDRHVVKIKRGEYLFPQFRHGGRAQPCEPVWRMRTLWNRLLSGTQFEGLQFYALRHSFVSLAVSKNVPPVVLAGWVGHGASSNLISTTYSHFLPDLSVQRMKELRLFEGVSSA